MYELGSAAGVEGRDASTASDTHWWMRSNSWSGLVYHSGGKESTWARCAWEWRDAAAPSIRAKRLPGGVHGDFEMSKIRDFP